MNWVFLREYTDIAEGVERVEEVEWVEKIANSLSNLLTNRDRMLL